MKTQKYFFCVSSKSLQYYERIWGCWDEPATGETLKCKKSHFLVPVGGAMFVIQHCSTDVFRPGLLSNVCNFVKIWPCGVKLWLFLMSFRNIEVRRDVMGTPFIQTWPYSFFIKTNLFMIFWDHFEINQINLLGAGPQSVKLFLSRVNRWRSHCHWKFSYRCVQGRTLITHVKFGGDWMMYNTFKNYFLFGGETCNFVAW